MLTTLTAIILPCLPFLVEHSGAAAVELVVEKIGESAWEKAQAIWEKLSPKIEQDAATQIVADELIRNPDSEVWRAAFTEKLQALLESDNALKQAIIEILKDVEEPTIGTNIEINVESNQGQVIGQMTGGEAKNIGKVENIQGDLNF